MRNARELQEHLAWLDTFTPLALGVLSVASGIYTYLGVSGLLERTGALSFLAAVAYSVAVSVAIFVFWSYVLKLLPAMTRAGGRIGLFIATAIGCVAIVAMSSWLNAAALAGSAAVEQHLATTVQDYQRALERANTNAVSAQSLGRDVERARISFEDLSAQEASGELSGISGQGAVYRLLRQKSEELAALETQIAAQDEPIREAFETGNGILSRMRELIAEQGPVETRSIAFSEQSVRLAGVIATLRQLSVAPLVSRAAEDLRAAVVLPELDGGSAEARTAQDATIRSVLEAIDRRAASLGEAAQQVLDLPPPEETTYTAISTADAVIRYAGDFVPSWAGAIAIDLLPGVLVLILAVTQGAIRGNRRELTLEQTMTLSDLEAAMRALRRIETAQLQGAEALSHAPPPPAPQAAVPTTRAPDPDAAADSAPPAPGAADSRADPDATAPRDRPRAAE
ncbi:hypothetical protein [Oceanicella sp. SM1341]|uniref:hypothetical protein n=1 Tax=Oceanicella sp. SM1341 TaxID=1548889 RepID=UPI001E35DA68|nr:hypothetical protein [Oceanicella sp. SM1341]